MIGRIDKNEIRKRKHVRVRKKISGTTECPRLCVYRSNSHIYAQIIDDTKGVTLVSASTLDKEIKGSVSVGSNIEAAKARGGYLYHGRVQALAEAAREAGLSF